MECPEFCFYSCNSPSSECLMYPRRESGLWETRYLLESELRAKRRVEEFSESEEFGIFLEVARSPKAVHALKSRSTPSTEGVDRFVAICSAVKPAGPEA
jgi:hypothetical protein